MTELLRGCRRVPCWSTSRTAPCSPAIRTWRALELDAGCPSPASLRWDKRSGFRKAAPDSPDTAFREDMFRATPAPCGTEASRPRWTRMLRPGLRRRTVVMCSRACGCRCHRRLLAYFAWPPGLPVLHCATCCTTGGSEEAAPSSLGPASPRRTACFFYDAARPPCCGRPPALTAGVSPCIVPKPLVSGRPVRHWMANARSLPGPPPIRCPRIPWEVPPCLSGPSRPASCRPVMPVHSGRRLPRRYDRRCRPCAPATSSWPRRKSRPVTTRAILPGWHRVGYP